MVTKIIDVHCHLHEFKPESIREFLSRQDSMIIVAVSEDYASSIETLSLYETFKENIIPCVGVHPWSINEKGLEDLDPVIALIENNDRIRCLGEVGLDKKFVAKSYDKQVVAFKKFVEIAREHNLVLNIHAAGAWREVFDLLVKNDIEKAVFHWYTGPLDLLNEITNVGYYISINPAVRIQEKHMKILLSTPITHMLAESDGPYKYRGMYLTPLLVPEVYEIISDAKNLDINAVRRILYDNFRKLFDL